MAAYHIYTQIQSIYYNGLQFSERSQEFHNILLIELYDDFGDSMP